MLCHSGAKEVTREVYERLLSSSKSNTLSGNKKAERTDGADVGRGWTRRASAGSFTRHRIPLCTAHFAQFVLSGGLLSPAYLTQLSQVSL